MNKVSLMVIWFILLTLLILGLTGVVDFQVISPIIFFIVGITNLINGYQSYKNNNKKESKSLIWSGLFSIIVSMVGIYAMNT